MNNYIQNNHCGSGDCSSDHSYLKLPSAGYSSYTPMKHQMGDYKNQQNIYTTI